MESIGDRLRLERERLFLTQAELAEKVGIHRVSQSNYERCNTEPDAKYWQKLDKLGFDIYYILTGKREK